MIKELGLIMRISYFIYEQWVINAEGGGGRMWKKAFMLIFNMFDYIKCSDTWLSQL